MAIKVIPFMGRLQMFKQAQDDCVVLRMWGKDANHIEVSFPFHEDTPNFLLTIPEALDIKNAIDQLIDLKMLEKPREE